jgi:hypothetical protein
VCQTWTTCSSAPPFFARSTAARAASVVFSIPSVASSIFSGNPLIFRLISSLSSSTLFQTPAFPEQAFNPRGIHVGDKLPLPGLPKDGEHLLCQSPALIRRQVSGVDGLLFGLKPAELGQVPVNDPPHSSIDLLAREPSSRIKLLHMGTVTSSKHCRPRGYVGRVMSAATPGFV